ncbi:MAG: glutamine-hydrolyzing GMP synthase [Thermofilaceae archaeon]|nr:glutamine-hydrolyzing GMP synthase [Thermofilaceae archaeon]
MGLDPARFVDGTVREIRRVVGDEKALAACSGGVDSTVAAVLAKMALGERLKVVYIDDGFRRYREPEYSLELLSKAGLSAELIDAKHEFYKSVAGLSDAEEKRKAFRHTFYTVLGRAAKSFGARFLVQGTIAPDIIETAGGVKTQHNVLTQIGLDPRVYGFEVVEPLRELFKPQVREVARYLGLPKEISERMPFPGPGLLIRVVGETTPEKVEVVRQATRIIEEETSGLNAFQTFAVLLPGRATGLKEGKRVYGYILAVRVVKSADAMTAEACEIPYPMLKRIAKRIIEEVPGVSRVLYDVTDKPPATIEFE